MNGPPKETSGSATDDNEPDLLLWVLVEARGKPMIESMTNYRRHRFTRCHACLRRPNNLKPLCLKETCKNGHLTSRDHENYNSHAVFTDQQVNENAIRAIYTSGNASAPLTHIATPLSVGTAYPTTQHHLVPVPASATAWLDAVPGSYGRLPYDIFPIANPQGSHLSEINLFQQLQFQQRMDASGLYRQQEYLERHVPEYAGAYNYLNYVCSLHDRLKASGLNMTGATSSLKGNMFGMIAFGFSKCWGKIKHVRNGLRLQGSTASSPSPLATESSVYGTGSNVYEPSPMSSMHRQVPGLDAEAGRKAARFDCRLIETRDHQSDVDDSNDECYDDDFSNRSTDGVSSSTSSSNNSFDDRNLDRKNDSHQFPLAAPPSPEMIDADDEPDECDAGPGYDVMLAGTNVRSGCRGSLTWSGEKALFGLRKGSLDTMTLHKKSADGHGQHSPVAATRIGARKSDITIPAQTSQADIATRFEVRRSSTPPCDVSGRIFHHSRTLQAAATRSAHRPPPLDFESLKEKLEKLMTSGSAIDVDKKLGSSPMNSKLISRSVSKDGCNQLISSLNHNVAVPISSISPGAVVNDYPGARVAVTNATVVMEIPASQRSTQSPNVNEVPQLLKWLKTSLQSPIQPRLSGSSDVGLLPIPTYSFGEQDANPESSARYAGSNDALCDVVKYVIKTSPVAQILVDYVTVQALEYHCGLKVLQQRHRDQMTELQQKHQHELNQLALDLSATRQHVESIGEHIQTTSRSSMSPYSLSSCQQIGAAAATSATSLASLKPPIGVASISERRSFSLPHTPGIPTSTCATSGSPSVAVPLRIGPLGIEVPAIGSYPYVSCNSPYRVSVVTVTEAQNRSPRNASVHIEDDASICCCDSSAYRHTTADCANAGCRVISSTAKQSSSASTRELVSDGGARLGPTLRRVHAAERRLSLCNDVTRHRHPKSRDHVTHNSVDDGQTGSHRRMSASCCLESASFQAKSRVLRRREEGLSITSAHRQHYSTAQNHQEHQQQQQQSPPYPLDHQQVVTGNYHYYQQLLLQQQQLNYLYGSGMAAGATMVDATLCSQRTESNAVFLPEHQNQCVQQHQLMTAALQQEQQLRLWFQQQQFQRQFNALGVNHFQPCFPMVPNTYGFSFNHQ